MSYLAKRQCKRFPARLQNLDREEPIRDGWRLPHQLIEPRDGNGPVAMGVGVEAVADAGRLVVE
jgi:hypothetical protein